MQGSLYIILKKWVISLLNSTDEENEAKGVLQGQIARKRQNPVILESLIPNPYASFNYTRPPNMQVTYEKSFILELVF